MGRLMVNAPTIPPHIIKQCAELSRPTTRNSKCWDERGMGFFYRLHRQGQTTNYKEIGSVCKASVARGSGQSHFKSGPRGWQESRYSNQHA